MARVQPQRRFVWLEWVASAAVLVVGLLEALGSVHDQHWNGPRAVTVIVVILISAPLLTMRSRPVPSVLVIAPTLTIYCAIWGTPSSAAVIFVMLLASFGAGRYRGPRERWIYVVLTAMLLVVWLRNDTQSIAVVLFFAGTALAPFAAGRLVTNRQRLADQLRAQQPLVARAAVVDERARIARELHDVVAHGVSVMVIQSVAARTLLSRDPAAAEEPLKVIETTGQEALGELRRLLGVLRSDADEAVGVRPQPGLEDLDALIRTLADSGLRVDLRVSGDGAALTPGINLAAYRIVQEALTNVIRHSVTARAAVTVERGPDAISLEIVNEGPRAWATEPVGGGHGLPGMRERAALYGGHLEAGPRKEGGYAVRALLPTGALES